MVSSARGDSGNEPYHAWAQHIEYQSLWKVVEEMNPRKTAPVWGEPSATSQLQLYVSSIRFHQHRSDKTQLFIVLRSFPGVLKPCTLSVSGWTARSVVWDIHSLRCSFDHFQASALCQLVSFYQTRSDNKLLVNGLPRTQGFLRDPHTLSINQQGVLDATLPRLLQPQYRDFNSPR